MKLNKGAVVTVAENLEEMLLDDKTIAQCRKLIDLADHKYEVYKLLLPVIGEENARWISLII